MSNVFFYEPFYDLDRLVDQMFNPRTAVPGNVNNQQQLAERRDTVDGAVRAFKPRMDLHEDSEKNVVTATFELPGVKKEDVQIDVHNGRLTVAAELKSSTEFEENGYAVKERRFGKFSRTLQLPNGIKDEDIKAGMENGVLSVTFPKSTPEQAPKRIQLL